MKLCFHRMVGVFIFKWFVIFKPFESDPESFVHNIQQDLLHAKKKVKAALAKSGRAVLYYT